MWQWPIASILALGQGQFQRLFVEQGDAGQVRVRGAIFRWHPWHVAGTQEGHGQAPGLDRAAAAGQRQHQRCDVDGTVGVALHGADHAGAVRLQQRTGGLQAPRRVVVAGDDDQVQMRHAFLRPLQEAVQLLLRRRRRIGVVEDVAGDQQGVGPLADDGVEQPVQEALVFVVAFEIMQGLAEMPVGSVQQTHGSV
jgi:hypothetical protein